MSPVDDQFVLEACRTVPAGRWAVGVSGGLDSTALLLALQSRSDLHLHVAHLNHELRGLEAAADAAFVRDLSDRLGIDCTIARRSELEPGLCGLPINPSARYRAVRVAFFARLIDQYHLSGVILAHHADDQAETVLFRLLRGSGWAGLTGMKPSGRVKGVRILRPLLNLQKCRLAGFLQSRHQSWREDASNQSGRYARNRLRRLLADHPSLVGELLRLQAAAEGLQTWVAAAAPKLDEMFSCDDLARLPAILARRSARQWLVDRGMPAHKSTPQAVERLRSMAADAATPATADFPGRLRVVRRQGRISAAVAAEPRTN